jgi:hypothetical protein
MSTYEFGDTWIVLAFVAVSHRARPDAEAEKNVRGVAADQLFERERRTWRELFPLLHFLK